MITHLTERQARRLRLIGQRLVSPQALGLDAAASVCHDVCGLQAQDIFAASLGVRVRSHSATLNWVEHARFAAVSVIWTWAMRGTLHLISADDLDWMLAAVGPAGIAGARTRRLQLGLDDETYRRGLGVVRDHLGTHGPSTREELGAVLQAMGLPAGYSVERQLLHRAALEGVVCMGPNHGAVPTFVLLEEWLGRPLRPVDPEPALEALVTRYVSAYAPTSLADFATWSGLPIGAVRHVWERATAGMEELIVQGRQAWAPRGLVEALNDVPDAPSHVSLLPPFDVYLLGHRDRTLILAPEHADRILAGGIIKGALLVDGAVAGAWRPNRTGKRVRVTIDPFGSLSPAVEEQVAAEIVDMDRFLAFPAA